MDKLRTAAASLIVAFIVLMTRVYPALAAPSIPISSAVHYVLEEDPTLAHDLHDLPFPLNPDDW